MALTNATTPRYPDHDHWLGVAESAVLIINTSATRIMTMGKYENVNIIASFLTVIQAL
jgi:hypothetical protein